MPVLQPVSDTASCGPRHVMLLLSLWASSQFLKQTRALSDVLLEAPGEGGELAEVPSCSAPAPLPSACPSSSPGGSAESLGMQQGVRISFRSHPLSPASGREVQWIFLLDGKGSGVAHVFHTHRLFLVLCYCRIFFGLMFAQALGTKICHFVSLIVQL